jgi:hypothetical protein
MKEIDVFTLRLSTAIPETQLGPIKNGRKW